MKHIKWLILILVVVLAVIIISQNMPNLATPVAFKIDLWFVEYHSPGIPLGVIAVIAFLIGALAMAWCGIMERFRLKKQVKVLTAENKEMEKELNSYRNMSVSTETVNFE